MDIGGYTEHAADIINILSMYGINHFVDVWTRITPTTKSCLDNVLTNLSLEEFEVRVHDTHIADHIGVYIRIKNRHSVSTSQNSFCRRMVNNSNISKYLGHLKFVDWSNFLLSEFRLKCVK